MKTMPIVLQPQDDARDLPQITAEVQTQHAAIELTAWLFSEDASDEHEDPEHGTVTDCLRLSHAGWGQLVELFAVQHGEAFRRIAAKLDGLPAHGRNT